MDSMLSSMRILDLTDNRGWFAGGILADLGAEVIKVNHARAADSDILGPFYHDQPHENTSLNRMAFNAGKKAITLDIESPGGKQLFTKLATTSDCIIESSPPGYLEGLGLGYTSLSREVPTIIVTSITPFGQTGPWRDFQACDLSLMALSGIMYMTGDPDRAPLRLSPELSYRLGSAHAVVGTLLAYHHRQLTGEGQHVDVSILECLVRMNYRDPVALELEGKFASRRGSYMVQAGIRLHNIWPCRDGYVVWMLMGGRAFARQNYGMTDWLTEEGIQGAEKFRAMKWETLDMSKVTQGDIQGWEEIVARLFLKHTKKELGQKARSLGIMVAEINDLKEVREQEQLVSRGFWVQLEHPELGERITYPGHLFLSSRTEARPRRRAPLTGEHNREIYEALLGLSSQEVKQLGETGIIQGGE